MAKIESLEDIGSLANTTSARAAINANSERIEEAFVNTLSRDGSQPNQMEADIDLNDHYLLNVADPVNPSDGMNLRSVGPVVAQYAGDIAAQLGLGRFWDYLALPVAAGEDTVTYAEEFLGGLPAMVYYNGIFQHPGTYTAVAGEIVFDTPLEDDGEVVVAISGTPNQTINAGTLAYTAEKSGAASRTIRGRLSDSISVKDFAAVGDGVTNDAPALLGALSDSAGEELRWPEGDYAVAAPLPGLHEARHTGTGRITRGASTFYVNPVAGQANTLYVDPAGSDANDGLTSDFAFATLQAAFDALANYGPMLQGTWTIQLAAGTYTEGALFPTGLSSRAAVVVAGPDVGGTPNVPTAIIDGTTSVYRRGLGGTNRLRLTVRDIKVQGFDGTDEAGVEFSQYARVTLNNVHVDNCYYGLHFLDFVYYDITGGIIENCDTGVQELFGVVRNFKPAGSDAGRTTIRNCTSYGLKAKELCTGHLDYALIDNCNNGVFLMRGSTANLSNCDIYNNTIGAVCNSASTIVDTLSVDWGAGTANANTVKFLMRGGSSESRRNGGENVPTTPYIGLTEKKVGFDYTSIAHTGTTTRTVLYTPYTVSGGDLQAVGAHVRFRIQGSAALSAGTCVLEVRAGAGGLSTVTLPTGTYAFMAELAGVVNAAGDFQLHTSIVWPHGANPILGFGTRTVAFSGASDLALTVNLTLANAADTVTLRSCEVFTTEA